MKTVKSDHSEKTNNKSEGKKKLNNECFIITPIGNNNSDIRRHAEGVINAVIKPLLENEENGFKVVVAHEINDTGSIPDQVFNQVVNAKLVIANVTGLNPNVMYELGVRHALRLPVITIAEEGTNLPFDINSQRTIFYENDMFGTNELKTKLAEMLKKIDFDEESTDNPVMSALRKSEIFNSVNKDDKEQQLLMEVYGLLKRIEYSTQKAIPINNKLIQHELKVFKTDDITGNFVSLSNNDLEIVLNAVNEANIHIVGFKLNMDNINLILSSRSFKNLADLSNYIEEIIMKVDNRYKVITF